MAKIRTFARIKPSENLYDDFDTTHNRLYVRIPDSYSRDSTLYNRTRAPIVNHEFKYSQVFPAKSKQQEVFDVVARNIIDGFLEGYNGTIFAYGQTASGKTHTMQGNLSDHEQKGLAPRSLTRIFSAVNARKEAGENISVHCSFLEIYQEVGYDLLKPTAKNGPGSTGFSKVTVVDGPQGAAIVKNLSILAVNGEEAAQSMLAQGEMNRKVAETAMNNRSSRSHAVFTVYLSSRKGDLLVRSKMHFVDLAGSERVCKTGVKGLQLSEAKYINLSLHYLEGVIIALHQDATSSARLNTAPSGVSKSWSALTKRPYSAADSSGRHIPYRNSLLTMLLKDSLGGNCLTTMIATISLELSNLSESISTCRFAQRVSCISNTARKNEEIDDKSMIKKLRTRVAELEVENSMLKHGGSPHPAELDDPERPLLTSKDKELCQHIVKDFLNGRLMDPIVAGVTDPFKFRECMSIFKKLIKETSDKSLRIAEQLKQQPSHVQEAFFTGGRYHEAPLAKPSKRHDITFRDDANTLTKHAYANWSSKQQRSKSSSFRPTILKSTQPNDGRRKDEPAEAWQLQLAQEERPVKKKQVRIVIGPQHPSRSTQDEKPKPKSAAAALRRVSTPFERKRNQEVAQLNKKVEANLAQQLEQTNHLNAFKKTVAEQEFEIVISSLTRKLEVTQHQLADQHAYTVRLQQQTTDKHLIEQETLVKRQLQKRVDRLYTELNAAKARLAEIKQENENEPNQQSTPYRTVKDKFSDMTKKDGSLDAVKVKSTLQQQEKLQSQLQRKIDRQRALTIDKHLEIQELSTRQKLEEFKRKLAESRQTSSDRLSPPSIPAAPQNIKRGADTGEVKGKSSCKTDIVSTDKPMNNQPSETFQSRIRDEHSISEILNKYRTGSGDASEIARASKRTAQVDHILAKYTSTKPSAGVSDRKANNHSTSKSASPDRRERDVSKASGDARKAHTYVAHTRIRVPNSEMEYSAPVINGTTDKRVSTRNDYQRTQESGVSVTLPTRDKVLDHKNFETTLQAMLQQRQGNNKRRTDAWESSTSASKKQELQEKRRSFLMQQAKKKQQQTRSKSQEKTRPHTSDTRLNMTEPQRQHPVSSQAAKRQNTNGFLSNNKEFSHRMSHYNSRPRESERRDNDKNNDKLTTSSQTTNDVITPQVTSLPAKEYNSLKKLSKRNEHTTQVRKIQNAAIKIQRMWRQHLYRN